MDRPAGLSQDRNALHTCASGRQAVFQRLPRSYGSVDRQFLLVGRSNLLQRSTVSGELSISCSSVTKSGLKHPQNRRLTKSEKADPVKPGNRTQATTSKSVSAPPATAGNQSSQSAERVQRLATLVQLRRLYQNVLHAEVLLDTLSPVYEPVPKTQEDAGTMTEAELMSEAQEEEERKQDAVAIVAEMQLTADELEAGLKALPAGFGGVYRNSSAHQSEQTVRGRVRSVASQLRDRAAQELALLPYPSVRAAQAVVDARNSRFRLKSPMESMDSEYDSETATAKSNFSAISKLGKAERVAEKFVSEQLQPAVQKVRESSPKDWAGNVKAGAVYAKELWDRLNGGGQQLMKKRLPEGLPLPGTTKDTISATISSLSLEVSNLEKQLKEASKQREARLRNADISTRARMASELRKLDDEVATLTRTLAVRTLQLEMEYIYGSLEEEATDIATQTTTLNMGSDDELDLLSAEFAILDDQLAALQQLVDRGSAIVISEEELVRLATEIPDLRSRLGIGDDEVFGGSGISWLKLQLQVKDAAGKVREGVDFGARGVRLLVSDVGNAGRLFWRAALGDTLKPREVLALRRTARDVLTFVPFTVILVAPLTPVGHVLIFGFIQRYFPGFFPSQFTNRRQDIMVRYEELQKQLARAQELAAEQDEEAELARASAAVARLTAPIMAEESGSTAAPHATEPPTSSTDQAMSVDSAAARVEELQKQLQQAEEETLTGMSDEEMKNLLDKEKEQEEEQKKEKKKR